MFFNFIGQAKKWLASQDNNKVQKQIDNFACDPFYVQNHLQIVSLTIDSFLRLSYRFNCHFILLCFETGCLDHLGVIDAKIIFLVKEKVL